MKFKKSLYTLLVASCAFLAYNSISQAETTTVVETKEISPFENSVITTKTTTTTSENKVNIEDIEPAVLMELKPEVKEIIQEKTVIKEKMNEDGTTVEIKEITTDNVKIDAKGVTDNVTQEVKVIETKSEPINEVKKETLPVLEEIELPQLNKKPVNNEPVKIEVASQRIPVGTVIPLRLESSINSVSSSIGDQFNATLTSDIMVGDSIVLPAGSVVRGTIGKLQKASMLVREAKILLIFDHIVTPAGKQIPVYAYMTGNSNVNYEGYFTGGTSYAKAFKKDAAVSKDILVKSTTFGVDKGLEYWGGVPVVLTAPLCAIGGTLGGGGYLIGKSIYNIFTKGGEVLLQPGTVLNVTLSKALDIPVN